MNIFQSLDQMTRFIQMRLLELDGESYSTIEIKAAIQAVQFATEIEGRVMGSTGEIYDDIHRELKKSRRLAS